MKWEHTPLWHLCTVTLQKASACALRFRVTLRQEHHSFGLDDTPWRDGRDDGRRGLNRPGSLRGLCRARPGTHPEGRAVSCHGQPLKAHKPARVRELIEERGCELIYLPSYSPEFNPIEEAFSKIKGMVHQAGARTREALVDVLGQALSAISAQDARGYFEHAGYRPRAQLL